MKILKQIDYIIIFQQLNAYQPSEFHLENMAEILDTQ